MPFPYSFTFYSYKGGVGRSLALLNTAYVLASWGRHVLIVDMDLEAPGVGGLMTRLGELSAQPSRDLVDLLSLALEPGAEPLPPVVEFIRSVLPDKLDPLKPKFGEVGRLDVLAPDTDRDYTARLAALALQNLEQEAIVNLGQLLHRYFKEQRFDLRPLGLEDFEDAVKTPYDYILIDSRTGFTEIGGLCVGPLADRLVVVTGLNDQNITGTLHFLREVGIDSAPRGGQQPWDDADAVDRADENVSLGPKPTIVVASPVPAGEIEFKRERLDVLEKKIGIRPLRVSYHPRLALMETIFVRDFDDELPAIEYRKLADRLAAQVDDNADGLLRNIIESSRQGILKPEAAIRLPSQRPETAIIVSNMLFRSDVDAYYQRRMAAMLVDQDMNRPEMLSNWANALARQAGVRDGHSGNYFRRAFDLYSEATQIKPDFAEGFHNWGSALYDFASTIRGPQVGPILQQSVEKFAKAVDLSSGSAPAFFGWGNALSSLAERGRGVEAERLFEQSLGKYEMAIQNDRAFANAYTNWGIALARFAAIRREASGHLFEQAFEKFREALRLKPNAPVLLNWAMALAKFAQTLPEENVAQQFGEALEKCAEAVRLEPNSTAAYLHWGEILCDFADTKRGPEAEALFGQSLHKYEQAARLEPDSVSALAGWGRALMLAGAAVGGERAERYFAEARQKLNRAGVAGLFNLACLDAIQGDAPSAVARLREALAEGIDFASDEIDEHKELFDPIRDHPDFVEFLTQLPNYGNRGSIPNPGPSGTA